MYMIFRNAFIGFLFFFSSNLSLSYAQSASSASPWEVSGTLEVLIADYFFEDESKTNYFLNVEDGSFEGHKIEILFSQTPSIPLLTGDRLEVEGNWIWQNNANKLRVSDWSVKKAAPLKSKVLQTRKAIYLQVNFSDLNATFSEDQIVNKMSMNRAWYKQASYDQVDFPTDVDGNGQADVYSVTIGHTKAQGCDAGAIESKTIAAAQASGINMSLYQHRVLVLPPTNCGWAGLGHLGCRTSCTAWIASPDWDLVYTHELGHNLGMHHAGKDINDDGVLEGEYTDGSCPMGNIISKGFFNAPHTFQMQWLTETNKNVQTVSTSGEYILYAPGQDIGLSSPQIIRIKRDLTSFYYLGYRPAAGFDLAPKEFGNGVSIYSFSAGAVQTRLIRTLSNGEIWENPIMQIKQIEKTETYAKVYIQVGCFKPPEMTMTPAVVSIFPDSPAAFALQFTNRNDASCESINLQLSSAAPTGFQARLSEENILLAPGETKTVAMDLQTTLLDGIYNVSATALNTKNNQRISETSRVYVQKRPVRVLPGLIVKHYAGQWSKLPDFSALTPDEEKITDAVSLAGYSGDNFGLAIDGFIKVDEPGNYTLNLISDDGSRMLLRDTLFIDNDGLHPAQSKLNTKFLQPGLYPIRIEFFELGGYETLQLKWQKDGAAEVPVPASAFFYRDTSRQNLPPIVDAGPDETIVKSQYHLIIGSATDPDGSIVSHTWQQLSGPAVDLSNANSSTFMLKNLQAGEYVFRLTATDNEGEASFDDKKLVVFVPNEAPKVYAGEDVSIRLGEKASLLGTAEDEGKITQAGWRLVDGPHVSSYSFAPLSSINLSYSFLPERVGTYKYEFFATDDQGWTQSDQIIITVSE